MPTSTYALDLRTEVVYDGLKPLMIPTPKGTVETVCWGDGPAVVALHGAMGGYDQGVLLARTVAHPHFKFVAISRPGYLGTRLDAGETPQQQADLCIAVLDALGIERAAMVAISGGGPAALQFALRHHSRCLGLVMISACSQQLNVPIPLRWNLMKIMARIPGFSEKMRNRLQRDPSKAIKRAVPDPAVRERLMRDEESLQLLRLLQTGVLKQIHRRISGSDNDIRITRGDLDWPLEQISVPLLVVHGTRDSVVPYQQADMLTRRVSRAQLLSIEGGEHVSIFTHRAEIRERVDAFLSSI